MTAVVTGGGRGIGRATALGLAAEGAAVAVVARSEAQVKETADLITRSGGRALVMAADVTNRRAVDRVFERVAGGLGPVDTLVNNAGITGTIGPVWEVDPDEWWYGVEVHVRGTLLCARATLPDMIARRRGRIINVASNLGISTSPYQSSYASAKAAIVRFADCVAAEVRDYGVRVFAMSPGIVRTARTHELTDSAAGRKWVPQARTYDFVPPDLAVRLMIFLASGKADALTGRYLHISDDANELVRRAEEIQRDDLYAVRLRK